MKIVQSLWSKPGKDGGGTSDGNKMGWPDKKHNYFSWALSMLQFKRYYNEVELVTDKDGYDLLIAKMELPYTSVKVVLDDLNDYSADLYAIGKLYVYSIQEKPFIHADGDVYIWKKFDEHLENSSLLCQRKEEGQGYHRFYARIFFQMLQGFQYLPEVLERSIDRNNEIKAINAGIIGGHNLAFFKRYASKAFEFIDRNHGELGKIDVKTSNVIFEQFLFRAMAEEAGEEISYFNSNASDLVNDFADYTGVPRTTKYIHTPGSIKEANYISESLEYRFRKDYPDQYYKIINLLKTNQI